MVIKDGKPGEPGKPGEVTYIENPYDDSAIRNQLSQQAENIVELEQGLANTNSRIDNIDEVIIETVEPLQKEVDSNDRRITNLEYASKGVLYREESLDGESYSRDIPSDAMPYGTFDSIGGKTIVMNQMVGESYPKVVSGDFYEQTVEDKAKSFDVDLLKGKSVVWNQQAYKINSPNTVLASAQNGSMVIIDGKATITLNSDATDYNYHTYANITLPRAFQYGHKYYLSCIANASKTCSLRFDVFNSAYVTSKKITANVARKVSATVNANQENRTTLAIYPDEMTSGFVAGDWYSISDFVLVDLTAMFGSGNEPTTVQCDAIFTEDYYHYSEPVLMNVNAEKVVSKGANYVHIPDTVLTKADYLINGNIPEIPAGTYSMHFNANTISYSVAFADDDGDIINISKAIDVSFVLPRKANKMRMYCSVTGEYKNIMLYRYTGSVPDFSPYWNPVTIENTLITKYFPTGMKSAGSVADELDLVRGVAVQNVGVYTVTGDERFDKYTYGNINQKYFVLNGMKHISGEILISCAKYLPILIANRGNNYGSIYTYSSGLAFNTDESMDDFIAECKRNPFDVYYALTTPIETPIAESDLAVLRKIKTEQGGTITFENSLDIALPISVGETMNLAEWDQPLYSTHKYNHNGTLVTGETSVVAKRGDYLIDMTRAGVEDVSAYVSVPLEKNDGELVSADVVEMVSKGKNLFDDSPYIKTYTQAEWNSLKIPVSVGEGTYVFSADVEVGGATSSAYVNFILNGATVNGERLSYVNNGKRGIASARITVNKGDELVLRGTYGTGAGTITVYGLQFVKGSSVTDYSPYHSFSVKVDEIIAKYFPDGMHSAGSVYDVFDVENGVAVKNVRDLNLYEEGWYFSYTYFNFPTLYMLIKGNADVVNFSTNSPYEFKPTGTPVGSVDKSFWYNLNNYLYFSDSTIHNKEDFVDVMKGKHFYYALSEPIITPIEQEDLELLRTLHVEGGGTITFAQENFHLPVPNKETLLIKTGGVTA